MTDELRERLRRIIHMGASAAALLTERQPDALMDDARHYDPIDIENALRAERDELADLADRIEASAGKLESLSQDEQALVAMAIKLVLLRLG